MFKIRTMNKISPIGLSLFPKSKYEVGNNILSPDAILVRSADLHSMEIPSSVLAIARAGAGYNNIPVGPCAERGPRVRVGSPDAGPARPMASSAAHPKASKCAGRRMTRQ